MHGRRKAFLRAIALAKEIEYCIACGHIGAMGKSDLNSYYCSICKGTILITKDTVIVKWYEIDHGRRILKSYEYDTNSDFWAGIIVAMERRKKLRRGIIRG